MNKRWKKPRGVRVNPVTIRDAVARDNERARMECDKLGIEGRRLALKRLQDLLSGICGA